MSFLDVMRDVLRSESDVVRETAPKYPWLSAWRELAALTAGILQDDPRFQSVMKALDCCHIAYLANDWMAFQRASLTVRQLVEKKGA